MNTIQGAQHWFNESQTRLQRLYCWIFQLGTLTPQFKLNGLLETARELPPELHFESWSGCQVRPYSYRFHQSPIPHLFSCISWHNTDVLQLCVKSSPLSSHGKCQAFYVGQPIYGAFPSSSNHLSLGKKKKKNKVTHMHAHMQTHRRSVMQVRFTEDSITEGPNTNPVIWVFQN